MAEALVALILVKCKENFACAEPQAMAEALVALILVKCKENCNIGLKKYY